MDSTADHQHAPPCPFCALLAAAGAAKPEVAGHLAAATRELALAARALLDGYLEATAPVDGPHATASERDDASAPPRLRRIPLA